MLKKILISCLFLIFAVGIIFENISCAAWKEVTQENLTKALEGFVTSESNEENYSITVKKDVINITEDNEKYELKYDLTDKPTFSIEIPIEKGMSYEEFQKQTGSLILPTIGYIAVANIQSIDIEDASSYILFSYLGNALKNSFSSENSYWIIDDLNASGSLTVKKDENTNIIYASEFGDKVMEYVNNTYLQKQTISDSKEINSYEITIEKQDTTETSCKLVSTLTVNHEADFTKLNGYMEKIEDSFMDKGITKENADYSLTLKVGQKCNIESSEKLTGYELHGSSVEVDTNSATITAIKEGKANGYLYIGDKKKSVYITVEENSENETLETITLKIEKSPNVEQNEEEDNTNKLPNIEKLPQTGRIKNEVLIILYIIVGFGSIALINILLSNKKK